MNPSLSKFTSISQSDDERTALEAICPRLNADALLAWQRRRAFILLDAKEEPEAICRILDIDPTVLTEWSSAYSADGLASFGLKDYS